MNGVNHEQRKETDLGKSSNSLKIKTLNPEFSGNQKHPGKIQDVVMGWKEILNLKNKNEMDNEEGDEEKDWVYLEEEERARIEGQKDWCYLDWLKLVVSMLNNKEKSLVERAKYWVYIDRLLSNEDKARIEASLSIAEF